MDLKERSKLKVPVFLEGGGEMGELTRAYDWSSSQLGEPGQWPVNLQVTLSILLSSRFPMFLWWGEDLVQFYNDAYRPSLGNSGKHPAALGQKGKDCWPEIWDIIYPLICQVLTTGESTWSESQLVPIFRNGRIEDVYWTFSYGPIKSENGKVDGVLVVCHETTNTVNALTDLRKSEEQVRSMVESAPFPIAVYIGREMRISLANEAMLSVWGKGSNVIGRIYSEVLPELGNQKVFQQLDNVFLSGIAFHAKNQHIILSHNGSAKDYFFNYSFTPLLDSSGQVYGVMNTAADVTDLNVIRQKLERSENNLRNTILQAPVAMCMLRGPAYVVEVANERMFELWGKSAETMQGRALFDGLPEARDQGFENLLDGVYNTGESFSALEVPVNLPRNGRTEDVYINFLYTPYRDSDGSVSGVLAVATDVTKQVLAKNKIEEIVAERTGELAEANANLRKSNDELEQFAYIASHDLQEPLRKISIFTQMLRQGLKDPDERSLNFLDKISGASSRMTILIRDVLAYSQVTKIKEGFERVDLNTVIDATISDFEVLIEQKQAVVEYHDLPVIEAIPLQMSQLFANLISNSLKYARAEVPPHIKIIAEAGKGRPGPDNPGGGYYKIECLDNGIGFRKEYAEQIFNIFQRLHRKTEYAGTGIGLAICKRIAENHQGLISARPGEKHGAIFTIILPEKQPEQNRDAGHS